MGLEIKIYTENWNSQVFLSVSALSGDGRLGGRRDGNIADKSREKGRKGESPVDTIYNDHIFMTFIKLFSILIC